MAKYRNYEIITYDTRNVGFQHVEYTGDGDPRNGMASSLDDAKAQIDDFIKTRHDILLNAYQLAKLRYGLYADKPGSMRMDARAVMTQAACAYSDYVLENL